MLWNVQITQTSYSEPILKAFNQNKRKRIINLFLITNFYASKYYKIIADTNTCFNIDSNLMDVFLLQNSNGITPKCILRIATVLGGVNNSSRQTATTLTTIKSSQTFPEKVSSYVWGRK